RHHRAAGRVPVGDLDEAELRRHVNDPLLGPAGEVLGDHGAGVEQITGAISRCRGLNAVRWRVSKIDLIRCELVVERQRATRDCTTSERTLKRVEISHPAYPPLVAPKHLCPSERLCP